MRCLSRLPSGGVVRLGIATKNPVIVFIGINNQRNRKEIALAMKAYAARSLIQVQYANIHAKLARMIHRQHQTPSGLSQACHSFKGGEVGLTRTEERLRTMMMAMI
jgi:hypothetical protein